MDLENSQAHLFDIGRALVMDSLLRQPWATTGAFRTSRARLKEAGIWPREPQCVDRRPT